MSKLSNFFKLNLLQKIKEQAKPEANILKSCGFKDEIKKISTGDDRSNRQKKLLTLYFLNIPIMHNIPENCKSDPNCSEPTTKPKDMRISPDPNNLEE